MQLPTLDIMKYITWAKNNYIPKDITHRYHTMYLKITQQ